MLLAYLIQTNMVFMINNCMAEMTVLMPVSGGFISLAGKWVDPALGVMVGYNFFLYEGLLIPFEISAIDSMLGFWIEDVPLWAVLLPIMVLYFLLNAFRAK